MVDILGNILHATTTDHSIYPIDEERQQRARIATVAKVAGELKTNTTYSIRITANGGKAPAGGYEYVVTVLAFPELEGPIA